MDKKAMRPYADFVAALLILAVFYFTYFNIAYGGQIKQIESKVEEATINFGNGYLIFTYLNSPIFGQGADASHLKNIPGLDSSTINELTKDFNYLKKLTYADLIVLHEASGNDAYSILLKELSTAELDRLVGKDKWRLNIDGDFYGRSFVSANTFSYYTMLQGLDYKDLRIELYVEK
ncbi:hypothetical protein KY330_00800 [Candidatus Woesearchaeota archaeon]|nr:hypothetical protein [Candidatus Woesearchaeota archaeon]